jgi:hypothetical protein
VIVVLSGEGPTDLGISNSGNDVCEGTDFLPGPLAWMVDRLIEVGGNNRPGYGYSVIETGAYVLVSKGQLVAAAAKLKPPKKKLLSLPGRKKAKETAYFYKNARALAVFAAETARKRQDEVIAVLFRDADGTASAGRGLWQEKRQSMLNGFASQGFAKGVPMIPKPKSEAWLLCALRARPYIGCGALEERSGNDNSPNNLKDELAELIGEIGERSVREILVEKVTSRHVDVAKITMPSFVAFRDRLLEVL